MGSVESTKESTQYKRIVQYNKIRDEAFFHIQKKIVIMEMLLLTMVQ